ncbi:MAG: T9SS type A sorting domain-containing protein, partial [Candidatus Krumholzibacteria bacterium]|nr:T9SS type A sorting domain-containing protein [Candidatus Krumholzibacteria bacterium]
GGTATLGGKLSAQPSDAVELTLERSSGDTDISIQSGSVLEFSTSDWDTYKIVTFAAAADPDVENGSASVIVYVSSGPSAASETVRITESDDDDLAFVLDQDTVVVAEGGTSEFHVRLTGEPSADVHVLVTRSSGDGDITVQSGGSLIFTADDWDIDQTVVLAAADDQDSQDGEATIRIRVSSGSAVPDATLPARENDDDPPPIEPDQSLSGAIVAYPMPYRPDLGSLTVAKVPMDGSLDIYDLAGRKIWSTSWSGQTEVAWSGVNAHSCTVASGRYFMVVKNGAGSVVGKRTILIVR